MEPHGLALQAKSLQREPAAGGDISERREMDSPVGGVAMGLAVGTLFTAGIVHSLRTGTIKFRVLGSKLPKSPPCSLGARG